MDELAKQKGICSMLCKVLCIILKSFVNSNWSYDGNSTDNLEKNRESFYDTSSFVHHSIAIGEFKVELQSRNAQLGSNRRFFLSRATWKFDGWPLKTIGHLFYATFSFLHNFIAIWEFKLELQSGNTKFGNLLCRVTLNFDRWPWKAIGDLFHATSSPVHHFIAIRVFKVELQSGNIQFGSKLAIFCPVWPWNLTDDLKKQ